MTADLARLHRIRDLLADLDVFAAQLWSEAPSYRFDAPLDEASLAELEARIGVQLPEDYRGFLTVVGTTGPGPDYGLTGPAMWTMPSELPTDSVTITTVHGDVFTAGTGPRPGLPGEPSPRRPFPLTEPWSPGDDESGPPVPVGAHLYDGCLHLTDIGCGYSRFLVVAGPHRGQVWVDYSAGDGDIAPVAPFLDWYEEWLDDVAATLLGGAVREALQERAASPQHAYIMTWGSSFERRAADRDPGPLADLAALHLYRQQREPAVAIINELSELERDDLDEQLEALSRWADPAGADAATASPPLDQAAASPVWRLRRLLARNEHAPAELLTRLAVDPRAEVRLAVARHPHSSPDALATMAARAERDWSGLASLFELELVARHPNASPATVEALATLPARVDDEVATNVARAAALNPATTAGRLTALAGSTAPWVRAAVAANPSTPSDTVAGLARDPHHQVRVSVAGRPGAVELLPTLADDPIPAVRAAAAANPTTPLGALRRLGADTDHGVAYQLARNPAVPVDVIEVLRDHPADPVPKPDGWVDPEAPDPDAPPPFAVDLVAKAAIGDPGYPHALLAAAIADPDTMRGYAAGGSPWLDDDLLRALAANPYSYARRRVPDHPHPPVDVLVSLAHDPQPMVVRCAAARPEIPVEVLERLSHHDNDECRWGAADNPNTPVDVLRRLATDEGVYVRRAVLGNPSAPADLVAVLVRDPDPLVRLAAGTRDDLTADVLATLTADESPDVARTARWYAGRQRLRALTADGVVAPK